MAQSRRRRTGAGWCWEHGLEARERTSSPQKNIIVPGSGLSKSDGVSQPRRTRRPAHCSSAQNAVPPPEKASGDVSGTRTLRLCLSRCGLNSPPTSYMLIAGSLHA